MKFFYRLFLLSSILIVGICSSCSYKEVENKKPNILFILLDDLGKEWVGAYGAEDVKTPNIDELARKGMRFENVYSMPQCTPSRVTLLTGQYPWRHGWVNHYDVPRLGHGGRYDPILNPSFGKMLRDEGYATCIAGKWQINDFRLEPEATVNAGFDEYCMWTGGENGGQSKDPSQLRYWDPYIHTKEGSKTYKGQFGEDIFSDFIIDFMKENKEKPMLIYYPMCLPHGPLTTTPAEKNAPKGEQHKAMVRYTDFILNKLINALEELEIRKNTIIVWTTDNGTGVDQIGRIKGRAVRGGKAYLTENGINAPFIVNCPGIVPQGIVTDALVDFTDILPTFCELAGAEMNKKFTYDGHSFASHILGKTDYTNRKWNMALGSHLAMLINDRITSAHIFRDRVIRDKNYKVYVDTTGRIYEMIDLKNDLDEQINLIDYDDTEIRRSKEKFQKIVDALPKADKSPIYTKWNKSYYDHPAEALNKVSRESKKRSNKTMPVTENEYLIKQKK